MDLRYLHRYESKLEQFVIWIIESFTLNWLSKLLGEINPQIWFAPTFAPVKHSRYLWTTWIWHRRTGPPSEIVTLNYYGGVPWVKFLQLGAGHGLQKPRPFYKSRQFEKSYKNGLAFCAELLKLRTLTPNPSISYRRHSRNPAWCQCYKRLQNCFLSKKAGALKHKTCRLLVQPTYVLQFKKCL